MSEKSTNLFRHLSSSPWLICINGGHLRDNNRLLAVVVVPNGSNTRTLKKKRDRERRFIHEARPWAIVRTPRPHPL